MSLEENYTENSFFFDSYAFFEILKANKNYDIYKEAEMITTKLNLFELYSGILKEKSENEAGIILDLYYPFAVDFDKNVIEQASKLRNKLSKRSISMTDCIGYVLAMQLGVKFLTGDKEFENLENVEFVK